MSKRKYSLDDVKQAVANSFSYAQVLETLILKAAGGNYKSIKKYIDEHDIDISHFTGQGWSRGKTFHPKKDLESYLILRTGNDPSPKSYRLKKRLIKEGYKEHKCERCLRVGWEGQLIPIELHHLNGNSDDNRLDNLQILCNNCHALTETYRGKNIGRI